MLAGFRIGDKISAVTRVWNRQAGSIEGVSSQHPVAVARSGPSNLQSHLVLIDLRTGGMLQEFRGFERATFTPNGLGLLLHGPEAVLPLLWQFSSSSEGDPILPSFSLSPTGLRGRFIEVGSIQGPNQVSYRHYYAPSNPQQPRS